MSFPTAEQIEARATTSSESVLAEVRREVDPDVEPGRFLDELADRLRTGAPKLVLCTYCGVRFPLDGPANIFRHLWLDHPDIAQGRVIDEIQQVRFAEQLASLAGSR